MSAGERAEYGKLTTNAEREAFEKTFWARRDPDPGTPANEYRDEMVRRIQEANRRFRGEGRNGWLTERGRIFILLGPPDEEKEDAAGTVSERQTDSSSNQRNMTRGRIIWTYHKPPNPNVPPNTEVIFVGDGTGKFTLAGESSFSAQSAYLLAKIADPDAVAPAMRATPAPVAPTPPPAASAAGAPRAADVLRSLAAGGDASGVGPIALAVAVFPVPGDHLYVPVRFTPSWPATGEEVLRAGAFAAGKKDKPEMQVSLRLSPSQASTRSFALMLKPGSYRLVLTVEDKEGRALAAAAEKLDIPDFADGKLRTSSVVVARKWDMRPSGQVELDQIHDGLILGNLAIDAPVGNSVVSGKDPDLVFFVTGATPDAQGKLDIAATYEVLQGDKSVEKFPEQTIISGLVSQSLPISKLAPGAYTLAINLTDRASHKDLHETVPLLIE